MTTEQDEIAEKLAEAIQELIPKSLDDIIRLNRNQAQLRLTTEDEIFDLHQEITPGQPKDVIDEWNLISLHRSGFDVPLIFLLGDIRRNGHQRITSDVISIDLDRQLLLTKSGSLYQLGTPKGGDGGPNPSLNQLCMVASAFHSWGFGPVLGVPHFFYGD